MAGTYLVDTNIVSALLDQEAAALAAAANAGPLVLSSIVLGELYFGAEKSVRTAINVQRIEQYTAAMR